MTEKLTAADAQELRRLATGLLEGTSFHYLTVAKFALLALDALDAKDRDIEAMAKMNAELARLGKEASQERDDLKQAWRASMDHSAEVERELFARTNERDEWLSKAGDLGRDCTRLRAERDDLKAKLADAETEIHVLTTRRELFADQLRKSIGEKDDLKARLKAAEERERMLREALDGWLVSEDWKEKARAALAAAGKT